MSFEKVDDSWFLKDGDHNENHGVQSVDQEGVDVPVLIRKWFSEILISLSIFSNHHNYNKL